MQLILRLSFARILVAELLSDIFSAGFRVARTAIDETSAEKVINIDDEGFDNHTSTG
jgi:hypothetical protein